MTEDDELKPAKGGLARLDTFLLRAEAPDEILRDALRALGKGVEIRPILIGNVPEGEDLSDYIEPCEDSQQEVFERHGLAYVLCQVRAQRFIDRYSRRRRFFAVKVPEAANRMPNGMRPSARFAHDRLAKSVGHAPLEVICTAANFYKHHSEWPRGWSDADDDELKTEKYKGSESTIRKIRALGIKHSNPHYVIDELSGLLGWKNGDSLDFLFEHLERWTSVLLKAHRDAEKLWSAEQG